MAAQTRTTYISATMTDSLEIPTAIPGLSTMTSSKKVLPNDCDNNRQPEVAIWPLKTGNLWTIAVNVTLLERGFNAIHLPRLSEGRTQGRPKCAKNVLKWRIFKLPAWITGKRLKIDGYIQGIYTFHSNYGRICSHFGDIQRQRMAWPWNLGMGSFKVIEKGTVR